MLEELELEEDLQPAHHGLRRIPDAYVVLGNGMINAAASGHGFRRFIFVYSDLFEEPGPPDAPFHGGFGLMTREGVRKPVWFAYRYLAQLAADAPLDVWRRYLALRVLDAAAPRLPAAFATAAFMAMRGEG